MYDTLMQMGRWFGFRPGYLDLCRLYMTAELREWFAHITEAAEELRREFEHMRAINGTPSDYGLKVRSHPVMMVTSKVKMRHASEVDINFQGAIQETINFYRDPVVIRANFDATEQLLADIGAPTDYGLSARGMVTGCINGRMHGSGRRSAGARLRDFCGITAPTRRLPPSIPG